ncbi:hypothetical protein [Nostoc sp. LPT]|uniref:hypothetical protein n=1 Tax=Nostoc sp. LPT TaxID=2815387 RepID=UPI0025D8887F|nr:hypothetical protein [Nostoc sp. LPT]
MTFPVKSHKADSQRILYKAQYIRYFGWYCSCKDGMAAHFPTGQLLMVTWIAIARAIAS